MISKGNTHQNGAKLAQYITTAKEDERVERLELRGFASDDIKEAFRSVHVMAEGTKCKQPFFHCQVRNPEGEELTREQWFRVADRIESKLGLTDQPRAIYLHIDEINGHEHMHVAWSRIDAETLRAVPLPFFKERLKDVSRELEKELDLTRVRNERDGPVMAPDRKEFEEARRLGVDIQAVRNTIRDCFERSDNGRSFEAALADHGFVLAQGDRRAFVVIDHEGGIHALGKRILGITAAQTRERLADLDRDELPGVEQARSFVRERQGGREKNEPVAMRDPHRDEMAWQDALFKAAIEKEKVEREFVDPTKRLEIEKQAFRELSGVGFLHRKADHPLPIDLSRIEKRIWTDFHDSASAHELVRTLADHRIALAVVTKDEADRSHREATFARAIGNYAPLYREGEIVAVTEWGATYSRDGQNVKARRVFRLDARTTGEDQPQIERKLRPVRGQLQGLDATKEMLNARREERAELRLQQAQDIRRGAWSGRNKLGQMLLATANTGGRAAKSSGRVVSKTLDSVSDLIGSVLAPTLTPEQKRAGAETQAERAADAAEKIDLSQYRADLALRRQRQQQEMDFSQQQPRDDDRER